MALDWREYALAVQEPWWRRLLRRVFHIRVKCQTPTGAPGIEVAWKRDW